MIQKKKKKTEPLTIVFYIVVFLVAVICFVPFWMIVIGSLSAESDIIQYGYALWPRNF